MNGDDETTETAGFPFALLAAGYGAAIAAAAAVALAGFGLVVAMTTFLVGGAAVVVMLGLNRRAMRWLRGPRRKTGPDGGAHAGRSADNSR